MLDFSEIFIYLLSIPAVLLTLTVHEVSHGYMAYRLGDPTARNMGRLSLNPLRHLDPIGALCMLFFRFGWAKPVPINVRYFKNPKRDMALTALAGPLSNLIFAFLTTPICLLLRKAYISCVINEQTAFVINIVLYTYYFFWLLHSVNIGLGLFNLIPLPPLDGSRILLLFLPPRYYFNIMRYERYIMFGLMLFLLLGYNFGILEFLSEGVSTGMQTVWRLIPFLR